jgi:hypothetical protein
MKRTKKYNPKKNVYLEAKLALKNSAVGFVTGSEGCRIINLRTHKISDPSLLTTTRLSTLRHKWSVFIAVLGVDNHNKRYMKAEEIQVNQECLQSELVDILNEKHAALGKNFNKKHLVNYGWIGTPFVKEWQESEAFDVLTNLGAFEYRLEEKE